MSWDHKVRMAGLNILLWLGVLIVFSMTIDIAHANSTAKQQMSAHTDDLRALMLVLYEQNPDELAKSTQVGAREMTEWVFDGKANWKFEAVRRQQGTQAIALVFDANYTGDHILALVVGVETLLFDAYGATNEFDIPSVQDNQKLRQVFCELQGLLQKVTSRTAVEKQSFMLARPPSNQEIRNTLLTIIKRIEANHGNKSHLACTSDVN